MKPLSFPSAYIILVAIIVFVAILIWIVLAEQYNTRINDALGKEVAIAVTYHEVDPNPQSFQDIVLIPIAGFYDPDSYEANGIDVALFILFIGGFLAVVVAPTGNTFL